MGTFAFISISVRSSHFVVAVAFSAATFSPRMKATKIFFRIAVVVQSYVGRMDAVE